MILPESPIREDDNRRLTHVLCLRHIRVALLLLLGPASFTWAQQEPVPLIENIRDLHCAVDESAARSALKRLKKNINRDTGLPDEWEGEREGKRGGDQQVPQLHAGTLDLAVETTINQLSKFPELTTLGESVLLQWNYCKVFHNNNPYDLNKPLSDHSESRADYLPPGKWNGFARLGLGQTGAPRYIPEAFSNTAGTARSHLLYNWWNMQRYQCLPHPGNGQMFHRKQYIPRARVNTASPTVLNDYPLVWSSDCSTPFTKGEHEQLAREDARRKAIELAKQRARLQEVLTGHVIREGTHNRNYQYQLSLQRRQTELARHARSKAESTKLSYAQIMHTLVKQHTTKLFGVARATPTQLLHLTHTDATEAPGGNSGISDKHESIAAKPQPGPDDQRNNHTNPIRELTAEEAARNARQLAKRVEAYRKQLATQDKKDTQEIIDSLNPTRTTASDTAKAPIKPDIPKLAAALESTEDKQATSPISYQEAAVPPFKRDEKPKFKDRKYHGLSGSFALSNRSFESDAWSLTANISYKPIIDSYFFARTGFTLTENDDPLTYYWGIGYNDWHTDTWAFELNNWGPLKPEDGLKVEKAIASLSYKFDSALLQKYNLSSSLTLTAGKESRPTLTLAGTWAPRPKWFIRNLITQSLDGGDATWAYGFGFSDYRSNTWSLEYNNWGPNTLSAPNFTKNALVTLSWKWNL